MGIGYQLSYRASRTASRILSGKLFFPYTELGNLGADDATGKALLKALRSYRKAAAQPSLQAIEILRTKLNASNAPLKRIDYGSGVSGKKTASANGGQVVYTTVGRLCRNSSKSAKWARLLYQLVREYKPVNCLEMGTCLGISAAYQAVALRENGFGMLYTLEGAPESAALAGQNLEELELDRFVSVLKGPFRDTLPQALKAMPSLDYAFIDGHHEGGATLSYFEIILPHLSPEALLVFDDIDRSPDMQQAWKQIVRRPYIAANFELGPMGICLFRTAGGL
jgi:predicted O-methyltransferase YrrM